MATLILQLAGPMQAWGDSTSRLSERQTRRLPTKSGVIGLIAAAQGRLRDADLSDLASLRFGARADKAGVLIEDFQTEIDWAKAAKDGNTGKASKMLTRRYYLGDACFLAAFEGGKSQLEKIAYAIKNPVFPLYLGRRSCPPAERVVVALVDDSLEDVLLKYPALHKRAEESTPPSGALYYRDISEGEKAEEIVRDVPISFVQRARDHGTRGVVYGHTEGKTDQDTTLRSVHPVQGHDPFALLGG